VSLAKCSIGLTLSKQSMVARSNEHLSWQTIICTNRAAKSDLDLAAGGGTTFDSLNASHMDIHRKQTIQEVVEPFGMSVLGQTRHTRQRAQWHSDEHKEELWGIWSTPFSILRQSFVGTQKITVLSTSKILMSIYTTITHLWLHGIRSLLAHTRKRPPGSVGGRVNCLPGQSKDLHSTVRGFPGVTDASLASFTLNILSVAQRLPIRPSTFRCTSSTSTLYILVFSSVSIPTAAAQNTSYPLGIPTHDGIKDWQQLAIHLVTILIEAGASSFLPVTFWGGLHVMAWRKTHQGQLETYGALSIVGAFASLIAGDPRATPHWIVSTLVAGALFQCQFWKHFFHSAFPNMPVDIGWPSFIIFGGIALDLVFCVLVSGQGFGSDQFLQGILLSTLSMMALATQAVRVVRPPKITRLRGRARRPKTLLPLHTAVVHRQRAPG